MNEFDAAAALLRNEKDIDARNALALAMEQAAKGRALSAEEKESIAGAAFAEFARLLPYYTSLTRYSDKDAVMAYEDVLFSLLQLCYAKPSDMPEDKAGPVNEMERLIERDRFVENAVEELFDGDPVGREDIERVLCYVFPLNDEYRRGKLWETLIQNADKKKLSRFDAEALSALADYAAGELDRYLSMPADERNDDALGSLELLADACTHLPGEKLKKGLRRALTLNDPPIGYYAMRALLTHGGTVTADEVRMLAEDWEFAALSYDELTRHGLGTLFPPEYRTSEYLAKSRLVRRLVQPGALGQEPNEIEYLGACRKGLFGRRTYHVLIFRSDSARLPEPVRGQWLIGWADDRGGAFTAYTPLAVVDRGDPAETVGVIKKRLIGRKG